jgi:membrane-associated phospholipid phosphatase
LVKELFARPYTTSVSVLVPFCLFAVLVPVYLVIGAYVRGRTLHLPELWLDRVLPVQPAWTLVYGSLYLAVFLPMVVVHREEHIRRTLWAFVMVWICGSIGWLCFPTILQRPAMAEIGGGFCAWTLRIAYSWDAPYNCFPSLHVAQSFLAALTCNLVSRRIGLVAIVWASLVAVSTLLTKQHYVADVIAGIILASAAYLVCLHNYPRAAVPQLDERVVPVVLLGIAGIHLLLVAGFWVAYLLGAEP